MSAIAGAVKGAAGMALGSIANSFDRYKKEFRQTLEAWIKKKIQRQVERLVDRLPALIKNAVEDEDMPRCVSHGKDRAIDAVWPDFREEIMWEVAVLLDGKSQMELSPDAPGPDCFRRFFRFHLYPHDKTFWGKLRDPVFVIFALVSLAPVSGLCSAIFLFIFLILDKTDEYQCVAFILQFKGTQFISHGIVRSIVGFFTYINCVSAHARLEEHNCEVDGPGVKGNFQVVVGGFFIQVFLVWGAFAFLICCSESKGRSVLQGAVDFEHVSNAKKGGFLRYLLFYDLACFILVFGFLCYVISTRPAYDDWTVRHTVFSCQVVYGYLSLPFFFFTLPLLQNVLTHTVPTGYDDRGRCRKLAAAQQALEARRTDEEIKAEVLVDSKEADGLLDEVKTMFLSAVGSSSPR